MQYGARFAPLCRSARSAHSNHLSHATWNCRLASSRLSTWPEKRREVGPRQAGHICLTRPRSALRGGGGLTGVQTACWSLCFLCGFCFCPPNICSWRPGCCRRRRGLRRRGRGCHQGRWRNWGSDGRPSPQPDVSITRRSSFPAGSLARIVSNHPPKNSSQRKIGQERMGQRATTLRAQGRGPPADPEQSRSAPQILLADGHLRSRPPLFHTRSRAALAWCEPSPVENRSEQATSCEVLPRAVQPM